MACDSYPSRTKQRLVIWEDTTRKEIKAIEDCERVLNCFFAREWFIVVEQSKVVIYDQKKGFQKLLMFDKMDYEYSTMKYFDDHFFFAFADHSFGELNVLILHNQDEYMSLTPSIKEKRGLVVFSADLKHLAYTTLDTKLLKVFSVDNFRKALYSTKLGSHTPLYIYLVNEHIVLIYYSSNSFEIRDLSKQVKSYFIFSAHLSIKFDLNEPLCLYEHNKHTKPVVTHDIEYYDKKSIKVVHIVS